MVFRTARAIWYRMRLRRGVESCAEITVPAAEFTILVSIDFKLLSAMSTDEGVVSFLLDRIPMAVPPCHTALVGAEVFYLPTNRLHHDLTAVPARLATVILRMAADVGADRAGRDAHGQRDFFAALSLLEHLVDDFDVLFFHGYFPPSSQTTWG